MAIEHARICGACERECPSWASRCPTCGSLSLVHRITIAEAKPARRKTSRPRIAASRESPRPASARAGSTA
jgi:predicted ATP-dependent serine protease